MYIHAIPIAQKNIYSRHYYVVSLLGPKGCAQARDFTVVVNTRDICYICNTEANVIIQTIIENLPELRRFWKSTCQQRPRNLYNLSPPVCIWDFYSYHTWVTSFFCSPLSLWQPILSLPSIFSLLHQKQLWLPLQQRLKPTKKGGKRDKDLPLGEE